MLLKKDWQRLLVLAFGHGLNDFAAGYMLGNLLYLHVGITVIAAGFLVYNLLAFGGQYFAAILIEKISGTKLLITASAVANLFAVCLFHLIPQLSLVLAGCASALYHVAGGAACINENKAAPIGVFAAPGIAGLALAGYLSYAKADLWLTLSVVCICFIGVLQLLQWPKNPDEQKDKEIKASTIIDRHDVFMIVLLGIISLRSAIWNIFQVIHEHNYAWLLAIAASAFAGKLIGGWMSDKIGWKLYSLLSLLGAMPLVTFFKEEMVLFCIGIGLLQSAIPANTAMMIAYCKGKKEKGLALSFGTAVVIGVIFTAPVQLFSFRFILYWLLFGLLLLSLWLIKGRLLSFRS